MTIALAILVAMLSMPLGPSSSHDPAGSVHGQVATLDEHGHSHDLEDEDVAGSTEHGEHQHKHNPGDHSHEKLGMVPRFEPEVLARSAQRPIASVDAALAGLPSTLDRPPRPSEIA